MAIKAKWKEAVNYLGIAEDKYSKPASLLEYHDSNWIVPHQLWGKAIRIDQYCKTYCWVQDNGCMNV